jgi:hypothetical protein
MFSFSSIFPISTDGHDRELQVALLIRTFHADHLRRHLVVAGDVVRVQRGVSRKEALLLKAADVVGDVIDALKQVGGNARDEPFLIDDDDLVDEIEPRLGADGVSFGHEDGEEIEHRHFGQ